MLWDFAKALGLSLVLTQVVIGAAAYLIGGEAWVLPLPVIGGVASVLVVLFVLTAALVYRNAFHATFSIAPEGVGFTSGARERGLNRLAVLGGVLAGRPGVAGAGVLAATREEVGFGWEDIHGVTVYPDARVISLRNHWRTVLRLHCPPDLFDRAVTLTQEYAALAAAQRDRQPSAPLPTRRSRVAVVLWGLVAMAAIVATQAMFYTGSETVRLAVAGGLLVATAGVLTGIPMLAAVCVAFLVNVWLVMATFDAVTPYTEAGEFFVSAGGALLLLGMTALRPFLPPLNPRTVGTPSHAASH